MLAQIQFKSDLLSAVLTGKFSLEGAQKTFLKILEAVALQKSRKVLIDCRTLDGKPGVIERFYYGQFTAEMVISYEDRGISAGTPFARKGRMSDPASIVSIGGKLFGSMSA